MFIILYSILLIVTFGMGNRIYKAYLNPITIWASLWCVVGLFANLAFYEYYKPSNYVNIVIIIGIIVYTFYCVLHGLANRKSSVKPILAEQLSINIVIETFIIINVICILIELPFFIKALRIYVNYGFNMAYLRGVLTDPSLGIVSGGLISIIRDSGIKNVYTLSAIYAALLMVVGKEYKYKKLVIFIAIIETMEYCITNAARLYLFNFILFILFAMIFNYGKKILKLFMKNRKLIGMVTVLLIFGLIIQNSRASDMSILKTMYIYFFSGPSYLTQLLMDKGVEIQVNRDFYLGTVTLGLISNIYYYLKIGLLGINDSTVKLIASVITIKQYYVGSGTYINAMCTCFYPYLVDWGDIGIVIGPIITAWFACHYYKKMKLRMDLGSMAVCIYIFWVMFYTIFKWNLLNIDFVVLLIVNYFICPIKGQKFVVFRKDYQKSIYKV